MDYEPTAERPFNALYPSLLGPPPGLPRNALSGDLSPTDKSAHVNKLIAALRPVDSDPAPHRPAYLENWAHANFGNELQKPFWTIDDGIPILMGIDSMFASPLTLARHEFLDDTAFEAMRLRRLVADAQLISDLPQRFRPHQFINWALNQHIPVPEKLLKLAVSRGLPISGFPNPVETWKAKYQALVDRAKSILVERDANFAALQSELAEHWAEISNLRLQLEHAQRNEGAVTTVTEAPEPAPEMSNLSGMSRKYNVVSELFYGLAKADYGIEYGPMAKPDFKKLFAALAKVGINPDDATLEKHIRHGSEQAARSAKSQK